MFCFSIKGSNALGFEKMRQAVKMSPAVDLRFVIYRRELERQQAANAADLGDAAKDLIAHIEYTSNFATARKSHRAAARSLREFWGHLAADDLDVKGLEGTLARIDSAERRARQHYGALLSRYPRVPRILRAFGRFHSEVLNDDAAAQKLYAQADECEDERAKKANYFAGAAGDPLSSLGPAPSFSVLPSGDNPWSMFAAPRRSMNAPPSGLAFGLGPASPGATTARHGAGLRTFRGLAAAAASSIFMRGPRRASSKYEVDSAGGSRRPSAPPDFEQPYLGPSKEDEAVSRLAATLAKLQAGPVAAPPPPPPVRTRSTALRVSVDEQSPSVKVIEHHGHELEGEEEEAPPGEEAEAGPAGAWAAPGAGGGIANLMLQAATAEPASPVLKPAGGDLVSVDVGREELEEGDSGAGAGGSSEGSGPGPKPASASDGSEGAAASPSFMRLGTPDSPRSAASGDEGVKPAPASASLRPAPSPGSRPQLGPRRASGAGSTSSLAMVVDLTTGQGPASSVTMASRAAAARRQEGAGTPPAASEAGEGEGDRDGDPTRRRSLKRWARIKRTVGKASGGGQHAASIARMKWVVTAVLVAVAALAIAAYATVASLLGLYNEHLDHVGESGRRRVSGALLALHAQSVVLAGQAAWDPDGTLDARGRAGLREAAAALESQHVHLFRSGARVPQDSASVIKTAQLIDAAGTAAEVALPLFTAGLQLVASGRRFAEGDADAARAGAPLPDLYYAKENGASRLHDAFGAATSDLEGGAQNRFGTVRGFLIGMFASVTALLLVLAAGFFRPTVARVRREKLAAIGLFRGIPRSFVRRLAAARRGAPDGLGDSASEDGATSFGEDEDLEDPLSPVLRPQPAPGPAARRGSRFKIAPLPDPEAAPERGATGAGVRTRPRGGAGPSAWLQAPDSLTLQYGTAFFLLFVLFLAWFAVGFMSASTCETFIAERNYVGLLQSAPVRIQFHAREMAASPADAARQRSLLRDALAQMTFAHDALVFGNASLRLAGIVHRYDPVDALLFGTECFAAPESACEGAAGAVYREGLEALLLRYASAAALLANAAPGSVLPRDAGLQFLEAADGPALQPGLRRLAALFEQESRERLRTFLSFMALLFAAILVALALLYALVFRRLIARLSDEARRTVFMFLMLPADVIEASESIKAHLAVLASSAAADY